MTVAPAVVHPLRQLRARPSPHKTHTIAGTTIGAALLVGVWAWLASREPELILPSPAETGASLVELARDGVLFAETFTTIGRAVAGVAFAIVIGIAWGTLNGTSRWASAVSQAALASLMALPPIVLVVIGLIWFGPGAATTRL